MRGRDLGGGEVGLIRCCDDEEHRGVASQNETEFYSRREDGLACLDGGEQPLSESKGRMKVRQKRFG